jgi:hypothetical protein
MKFNKGDRVQIEPGNKGEGVCGEVFWKGTKKWGEGERLGVRGDDGETYWIDDDCVSASNQSAPVQEPGDTFSKGDRVSFKSRGRQGRGSVFWIGDSRNGPGQRLGINDDDGEDAVWIDARFAEALSPDEDNQGADGGYGGSASGGGYGGSDSGGSSDDADIPWTPPLDPGAIPTPPPMDDSMADTWASNQEDDDDGAW